MQRACARTLPLVAARGFAPRGLRLLPQRQLRSVQTDQQSMGGMGEALREGYRSLVHFRLTQNRHPLGVQKKATWKNPTQNHVWEREELDKLFGERAEPQPHHVPRTLLDKSIYYTVRFCYHAFNFVTGYRSHDPSPRSVAYRVLILESVAGVPGMVAAMSRHFRSLKRMERDNGWIHTLLEEAENERMHLLVFMKMFNASWLTRLVVRAAQYTLAPMLLAVYAMHPPALHRFVGYLEETAVSTYADVIKWMKTPGSQLHTAWSELPAPAIAKGYWSMREDASFLEVVEQIGADETHHRDVNHTFASMGRDEANPFVHEHHADSKKAWERLVGVEIKDQAGSGVVDTVKIDTTGDGKPDIELRDTTQDRKLDTIIVDGRAVTLDEVRRLLVSTQSGRAAAA
eukprot:TRINITY_DN202_c0_g2_i2.p1 TRINITY_DN202_c0_g2~~TRINITY_DN202_c0_g2_i2.p1  ORF type:complete len:421 (+),score=157.61 TRINITY_DN202_c0_g2_i2:62-1264(+)